MPKRTDIASILVIGAGPIVIGQACEFDYSGTQAIKALKEEGYRIILVNSNPATIMTDPELADATYVEPITPEIVAKIIAKERPDAGIPFGPPRPDPIVQNVMTREIAAEQPYIHRLTRLGQAAARRGRSLGFCHEAGMLIWGGQEDWHLDAHLAGAATRAGLDFAELEAEAAADAEALDAEIHANQAALEAAGHWGVPTLVFDGEPFFGQDRIEMAKWRMEQKGLMAQ